MQNFEFKEDYIKSGFSVALSLPWLIKFPSQISYETLLSDDQNDQHTTAKHRRQGEVKFLSTRNNYNMNFIVNTIRK